MAKESWLGIDLGTTVLKLGVFSGTNGKCRAWASRRLPVRAFPDGGRELPPAAIDKALKEIIRQLRAELGPEWEGIQGVGLAAQGGSSLIAGRGAGFPHTTMYLWNDSRGRAWGNRLAERESRAFWRRLFLFDAPPAGLGRLCWLRERFPDLFHDSYIHVGAGEYLFHMLTDVWRQDAGNAIQIGSYNARAKRLDSAAFDRIGVPLSFVAPLRNGDETARLSDGGARLLGLPSGIPVAGPYIDQEGCYMAAMAACARPLQCSLGTAWVGNFVLPQGFTGSSPSQLCLPEPAGKGYLAVQPLHVGNPSWDWALSTFLSHDLENAFELAARVFKKRLLPPPGMTAIPCCDQPNPFLNSAHGACVFAGMNTCAQSGDFVRAVAGGMVFELFRIFAEVKKVGAIEGVVLGGGASKGAYFRQLAAALFHPLPVLWQKDYDLAAARGVLLPLDARAARGEFTRVSSGLIAAEPLWEAYTTYEAAFQRIFGDNPVMKPFHCRARGSKA